MNTFRKLRAFCRVMRQNKLWHLRSQLCLRTKVEGLPDQCFCPLTYYYYVCTGEIIHCSEFKDAAIATDLAEIGGDIAAAADNDRYTPKRLKLRRILLKVCRPF